MTAGNTIITILVLLFLAYLGYTGFKRQTLRDTLEEIKDLFGGGKANV